MFRRLRRLPCEKVKQCKAAQIHDHARRRGIMATSEVEGVLDEWAAAWSAHNTEKILALYTDACVHEDVTFGVVKHGKEELRAFAEGTFAVVPDFTVAVTARCGADTWGLLEWV